MRIREHPFSRERRGHFPSKPAIALEPQSHGGYERLADVYEAMGRYSAALALHEKARALLNLPPGRSPQVARIYARIGKHNEARQILDALPMASKQILAAVYTSFGDKDEAFRLLFEEIEVRNGLVYVQVDPPLDDLHSDPRWRVLLRRMNLPMDAGHTGVSH